MKDVKQTVAENIKRYRLERGMTQRDLSEAINESYTAISNWENQFSAPNVTQMFKLCKALNVEPSTMMGIANEFKSMQMEAARLYAQYQAASPAVRMAVDSLLGRT